jgi:hypothetical protein
LQGVGPGEDRPHARRPAGHPPSRPAGRNGGGGTGAEAPDRDLAAKHARDIRVETGLLTYRVNLSSLGLDFHPASPLPQRLKLQALAARITNAQQDEILVMQNWLRDRHQPVPEADPAGMKMVMGGEEHHHLMPGMPAP